VVECARRVKGDQAEAEDAEGHELIDSSLARRRRQQHDQPHIRKQPSRQVSEAVDGVP
jgi:hypothetical protein